MTEIVHEQTTDEIIAIIDQYLPTVATGIDQLSSKAHRKAREDWNEDDIAIIAAYSAVHWMMKKITGSPVIQTPDYDLPSVLDLMNSLRNRNEKIAEVLSKFPETRPLLGQFEGRTF